MFEEELESAKTVSGDAAATQNQDKHDKLACDILGKLFPERKICPIDAQAIIIGGGNIHCITQQIPSGCGK